MKVVVRVQLADEPGVWEEVTVDVPEARNGREALVASLHHATHPLAEACGVQPGRVMQLLFGRVTEAMNKLGAPGAIDEEE